MESEYGAPAANMRAAIGPAANVCCYEVGSDVIDAFKAKLGNDNELFTPTRAGHALIDLYKANRDQLMSMGVAPQRIHTSPLCTMCRTDIFFSYRREKNLQGKVGRLMAVIGKVKSKKAKVRTQK